MVWKRIIKVASAIIGLGLVVGMLRLAFWLDTRTDTYALIIGSVGALVLLSGEILYFWATGLLWRWLDSWDKFK